MVQVTIIEWLHMTTICPILIINSGYDLTLYSVDPWGVLQELQNSSRHPDSYFGSWGKMSRVFESKWHASEQKESGHDLIIPFVVVSPMRGRADPPSPTLLLAPCIVVKDPGHCSYFQLWSSSSFFARFNWWWVISRWGKMKMSSFLLSSFPLLMYSGRKRWLEQKNQLVSNNTRIHRVMMRMLMMVDDDDQMQDQLAGGERSSSSCSLFQESGDDDGDDDDCRRVMMAGIIVRVTAYAAKRTERAKCKERIGEEQLSAPLLHSSLSFWRDSSSLLWLQSFFTPPLVYGCMLYSAYVL